MSFPIYGIDWDKFQSANERRFHVELNEETQEVKITDRDPYEQELERYLEEQAFGEDLDGEL